MMPAQAIPPDPPELETEEPELDLAAPLPEGTFPPQGDRPPLTLIIFLEGRVIHLMEERMSDRIKLLPGQYMVNQAGVTILEDDEWGTRPSQIIPWHGISLAVYDYHLVEGPVPNTNQQGEPA